MDTKILQLAGIIRLTQTVDISRACSILGFQEKNIREAFVNIRTKTGFQGKFITPTLYKIDQNIEAFIELFSQELARLASHEDALTESARMEKLKKIVRVSERLKISQMAQILEMNESTLYNKIVDWADQFGFTIDEDVVKFEAGRKDEFIASLDGAFQGWDEKTRTKDGKID